MICDKCYSCVTIHLSCIPVPEFSSSNVTVTDTLILSNVVAMYQGFKTGKGNVFSLIIERVCVCVCVRVCVCACERACVEDILMFIF